MALRTALGEEGFERASAEGELMGVGDAVVCALAFAARHAYANPEPEDPFPRSRAGALSAEQGLPYRNDLRGRNFC